MKRTASKASLPTRQVRLHLLQWGERAMLVASGVCLFVALVAAVWTVVLGDATRARSASPPGGPKAPPARNPNAPLIGIVAGHTGYDPGAVCPDGLTEAEVNQTVAREVMALLERKGIATDLLSEFDPRLPGYRADALVSIHADSCTIPGASGFKVARVTLSAIPQAEDRLVACLITEYTQATGLPEHPASITDGMTNYHAFSEITPDTPGAIIETGFMLEDRFLLESRPRQVARGIAAGIVCFLEGGP